MFPCSGLFLHEEGQEILFSSTDENGRSVYYSTGVWPDDNLVDRLSEHPDIKFNRVVPQENSFLMTFLLTWLFPTLLLMLPLILLSRYMQKKMGGNSMMFGMGKSGAKMYVASQTAVSYTHLDVYKRQP